jgi:hypothetical protein
MAIFRLVLAGLLLAPALSFSAPASDTWTQGRVTQIRKLVNTGEIRIGRASERAARVDDRVDAKQYVLTGSGALAELEFNDASLLRVGQNTVFTFSGGEREAKLDKGSVLFHDLDPNGHTEVRTPLLTCAVEGCLFVVQTFGTNGAFYLFHGNATVNGRKLVPGECLEIRGGAISVFTFDRLRAMNTGALFIQFPELALAREIRLLLEGSGITGPLVNPRFNTSVLNPPGPGRPNPSPDKPRNPPPQIPDEGDGEGYPDYSP